MPLDLVSRSPEAQKAYIDGYVAGTRNVLKRFRGLFDNLENDVEAINIALVGIEETSRKDRYLKEKESV